MAFRSFNDMSQVASKTFKHFPLVIIVGALIGSLGIYLVLSDLVYDSSTEEYVTKVIAALVVGLPLFLNVAFVCTRYHWNTSRMIMMKGGALAPTALYYLYLTSLTDQSPDSAMVIAVLLGVVSYLLIFILPFLPSFSEWGFWRYLVLLATRLFFTFVYCGIVYAGMALILASINALLTPIEGHWYPAVWMFIAGFVSPTIFFSGIPRDLQELDQSKDAPKFIQILAQYILLPLSGAFAIVLYLYLGKILVTKDWPSGMVVDLIFTFSGLLLITLTLLRGQSQAWMSRLERWAYVALLPLLAILFVAIGMRIDDYGVTMNRYYVVLMGMWLVSVAGYMLFSRSKSLQFLPRPLAVMLILSLFGPWGSVSVSEWSQAGRPSSSQMETQSEPHHSYFLTDSSPVLDIQGYDYFMNLYLPSGDIHPVTLGKEATRLSVESSTVRLIRGDVILGEWSVEPLLKNLNDQFGNESALDLDHMTFTKEFERMRWKLIVLNTSFTRQGDSILIDYLEAKLLIDFIEP